MLQGRTGTGCPSYGEDAGGPPTLPLIRDRRSAICNPSFSCSFVFIRGSNSSFQLFSFRACNGRLADYEPEAGVGLKRSEKSDLVPE